MQALHVCLVCCLQAIYAQSMNGIAVLMSDVLHDLSIYRYYNIFVKHWDRHKPEVESLLDSSLEWRRESELPFLSSNPAIVAITGITGIDANIATMLSNSNVLCLC